MSSPHEGLFSADSPPPPRDLVWTLSSVLLGADPSGVPHALLVRWTETEGGQSEGKRPDYHVTTESGRLGDMFRRY